MESLFQTAGVYPKWAVITFIIAILFSVASLVYTYHIKTVSEKATEITIEKVIP